MSNQARGGSANSDEVIFEEEGIQNEFNNDKASSLDARTLEQTRGKKSYSRMCRLASSGREEWCRFDVVVLEKKDDNIVKIDDGKRKDVIVDD